ncbi:MAG: guanylate kinase, partial [Desulfobacteraceae bacterium]|nr:guanylate kinase [Desulfobacteraceae bacterium]
AHFPDSLTIFIEPPSMKVLAQRLADRGTDEPEVVARRLRDAGKEMAQRDMYRHRIINGRLDATLDALTALVAKERTPTGRGE